MTIDVFNTTSRGNARVHTPGEWGFTFRNQLRYARRRFRYSEYDFLVEFTVAKPSACIAQLVSKGETPFTWSMNAGVPPRCRIEDINGHSVIGNPTRTPYNFEPGKRYV